MSKQNEHDSELPVEGEELENAYSPEYLREVADGEARNERLEELQRRIKSGAYKVDADWVVDHLLGSGDLKDD